MLAEPSVAVLCDELVDEIAQETRHDDESVEPAETVQATRDVQGSVGIFVETAVLDQNDAVEVVGIDVVLDEQWLGFVGLERGEFEVRGFVVVDDEVDAAVAQVADAVEQDNGFGGVGFFSSGGCGVGFYLHGTKGVVPGLLVSCLVIRAFGLEVLLRRTR